MSDIYRTGFVREYFKKKGLPLGPALTFADVVIVDRFSTVSSRSDITNLKSLLAKDFCLNIPIVSANMDTVTDSRMAIAMARLGGLGFIHQFFPLAKRKEEVQKVKRADNAIIENPVTVNLGATFGEAKTLMFRHGISSVLIVDDMGVLQGILTSRDYRFKNDDNLFVARIMTSRSLVTALSSVKRDKAECLLEKYKIEKLPLVNQKGVVQGLITAKDMMKERMFPNAVRDSNGRLCVGVTIRLSSDYLEEVLVLKEAGADVFLLDTARANSVQAQEAVMKIKKTYDVPLVVGNVNTPDAVEMLFRAGADGVKVGIGPGSACKTRETAGVGIPQVTAIAACSAIARDRGIPIIADGGIRVPADLCATIVAGASSIMVGSLFAGTDESPGELYREANQLWKIYRGSASLEHQLDRIEDGSLDALRTAEGVPRRIPYSGPLAVVIDELLGGLRSSMSYVGVSDLQGFWEKGEFVWQTRSGYDEGKPQE